MPEFYLDQSGDVGGTLFDDLSPFARGYIMAMFFTESAPGYYAAAWDTEDTQHDLEEGSMDGTLPCDAGFADLHPDTLAQIHTDCSTFERKASKWLSMAYTRDYSRERAGHDFWLTRNGHGAGFWDRSELEADGVGRKLTDIAKTYGEVNAYFELTDEKWSGVGYVHLD